MRSKQPFLPLVLSFSLLLALCPASLSSSLARSQTGNYTLQVAAFPEGAEAAAEEFVSKLTAADEPPIWGVVTLPGRGRWTRVFIGAFATQAEARAYGESLIARLLIKEFVIKKASEIKSLSRPRSVSRKDPRALPTSSISEEPQNNGFGLSGGGNRRQPSFSQRMTKPEMKKPPPRRQHPPPEAALARPPTAHTAPDSWQAPDETFLPPLYNQAPDSQPTPDTSERAASLVAVVSPASVVAAGVITTATMTVAEFAAMKRAATEVAIPVLDNGARAALRHAPPPETAIIPRSDPVLIALNLLAHSPRAAVAPAPTSLSMDRRLPPSGGVWLSGDVSEALSRLRWIVGEGNEDLLVVEADGRLRLDLPLLAKRAGVKEADNRLATLLVLDYLLANDGVLLLAQLTRSAYRFRLHLGNQAETFIGNVNVNGSVNLDNNFDRRINPYRRAQRKLNTELPPFGFDCLIAINPAAQWFNMQSNRIVQSGNITFHELAEAHAKVELGYEYLPKSSAPGAHDVAIEREKRLKAQRPTADVVLTVGSNRVIKSDEELRQLTYEINGSRQD